MGIPGFYKVIFIIVVKIEFRGNSVDYKWRYKMSSTINNGSVTKTNAIAQGKNSPVIYVYKQGTRIAVKNPDYVAPKKSILQSIFGK